ncbi:MAG: hypothetical protein IPJ69_06850 [Deltaproteobacteria bacterium]|nr:MAG: hypothetical protein IPJ69_06850 [Deltaproteobacteria bacterium]
MLNEKIFTLSPDLMCGLNTALRKSIFSTHDLGAIVTVNPDGIDVAHKSNGWNIIDRSVYIERSGTVRILGKNPTQHEHIDPKIIQRIIDILLGGDNFVVRLLKGQPAQSAAVVFS